MTTSPFPQLTWQFSSRRVYFKSPTDFLKIHQLVTWFILTLFCLSAFKTSFALEGGPPELSEVQERWKGHLYQTGRRQGPRDCWGGVLYLWNSTGLFIVLKWIWWTLRGWCKGSFVCSGSPTKGDVSICSGPVYLLHWCFFSFALFFNCRNASKAFPIGAGFF